MVNQVMNNLSFGKNFIFGFGLALVTFICDQINKWWMLYKFWPSQSCDPFTQACKYEVFQFFNYQMVWNPGVSYGLFPQNDPAGQMVLIIFALTVSFLLLIWLMRADNLLTALSIGLIIGGAVGNAVDRYFYGAVADFFEFHAFNYSWYVFNIADVAIVAGVIGLLYDSLTESRKKVSNSS